MKMWCAVSTVDGVELREFPLTPKPKGRHGLRVDTESLSRGEKFLGFGSRDAGEALASMNRYAMVTKSRVKGGDESASQ